MNVILGKHQLDAIKKLSNGSILRGGVGSGKSRTAIAYFFVKECGGKIKVNGVGEFEPMKYPRDLYIITTTKKRDSLDWLKEAGNFRLFPDPENSVNNVKVTVDSWNNIDKYLEVKNAFFIFDEQRLVGSGAWVKSFYRIVRRNHWILLSATPGDVWLDYVPVFVGNGFYKNKTDFTRRHVVYSRWAKYPKVERYLETGVLEARRREITVEMPYKTHTRRHPSDIFVEYDRELHDRVVKDRWHIFEERPILDIAEMISVGRKVINSHPSRLEEVRRIAKDRPGTIVFYNFNYELDILRELYGEFEVAEWNGHKHQEIPKNPGWVYLVQYLAGAEGWNCTTTDTMVFYSLNYSYRITEQARGRIDRLDTKFVDLYYHTLRSRSPIDASITKALRQKRDFNIKDFKPKEIQ